MLPFYINETRLIDLCAIQNGGFSEYEIHSNSSEHASSDTGRIKAGITLVFGSRESTQSKSNKQGAEIKKVQTIASILHQTIERSETKNENDLREKQVEVGDLITVPVYFKLNSYTLDIEAVDATFTIARIAVREQAKAAVHDETAKDKSKNAEKRAVEFAEQQYNQISKEWSEVKTALSMLVSEDEVFSETDDYAIVSVLESDCLYQSSLASVIETDLKCFGQIKAIRDGSTGLLNNSLLKKVNNPEEFIKTMESASFQDSVDVSLHITLNTEAKIIYEVEIIGLYI